MTGEEELKRNIDMLFIAVVAQAVKDLVEKDTAIRKSAERFFFDENECDKVVFPSDRATRFYETMRKALERAKRDGNLEDKIQKFKKYTVVEVKQKHETRTNN